TTTETIREKPAPRLQDSHGRRLLPAAQGIRRTRDGDGGVGVPDLSGAGLSIQQRDQTIPRVCGCAVWSRRCGGGVVDYGNSLRGYGVPRSRQPDWGNRKPCDRALRL